MEYIINNDDLSFNGSDSSMIDRRTLLQGAGVTLIGMTVFGGVAAA